jgi:hypothetical protein
MPMRDDMGKVLVERPRVRSGFLTGHLGRRYAKRVRQGIETGDGSARCEGIKRRYYGGSCRMKHFNEHLGPLRRFIDSNVGRPWNKVYAEISKQVDSGNVVQKHILTHLFQYVVLDVELIDGEPYRKARNRYVYHNTPLRGPNQWYVCPKSGLLKRAKPETRRQRTQWRNKSEVTTPITWISSTEYLRKGPGGWELVTVKPWPLSWNWGFRNPAPPRVYDVLLQRTMTYTDRQLLSNTYGKRVYAVAVRYIRDRELKNLPITFPRKLTAPNVVR